MKFFRDRIPALDGLRGFAVLLVLWGHLPGGLFGPVVDTLKYVLRPGYLGVDIFFVLSGFLITRSSSPTAPIASRSAISCFGASYASFRSTIC